jgi:hypothetical protein
MVLGVAGGIGFADFVFEYDELAALYLGGPDQPVGAEAGRRRGRPGPPRGPFQARRTTGPAAAERHLRAALDQGRPAVAPSTWPG